MIGSGPVSLGGDSEEKEDYTGGCPHWGVSGINHRLDTSVLGSYEEETSPLIGGALGQTEGLWEAWTLLVRNMHTLAGPLGRGERGLL